MKHFDAYLSVFLSLSSRSQEKGGFFCTQMVGDRLTVPGLWEELPASRVCGPQADDFLH